MDSTFQPHFNGKVIEIRHMGYDLISAILELTDNSVRKSCSSKKVRVILQKDNLLLNRISIIDDGCGMSHEKLCESFIFNLLKDREDGDIGKFHVGMKYALIAMGSQITLLTRELDGKIVGIFADIESMASRNSFKPCEICNDVNDDWALRHITPTIWEQFKSSPSGTLVDVKNLVPSCRRSFDKMVDAVKKGLSTAYTSLYNDCQIWLEDEVKKIATITPSDLFYYDDASKLDEPAYETTLKVYNQGIDRPERVIEVNTSHRRMPNGAKACTIGKLGNPAYYEFTEYEHGKKGKQNNMQKISVLPDEADLIASFNLRIIQVKKPIFEKEKLLFPTGTKLQGDRKGFWFLREIRCVGTAKQLGSKFSDRGHSAAERQRMLIKTSSSADDLTGSKFNKQMDDNALPCSALNDAIRSIYKQVIDPWNKKYDEIAKKEKAERHAANVASEEEAEEEGEEAEEAEEEAQENVDPALASPPAPVNNILSAIFKAAENDALHQNEAPVDEAPVDEAPVDEAPVDEAPVDEAPVDEAPVDEAPVNYVPNPVVQRNNVFNHPSVNTTNLTDSQYTVFIAKHTEYNAMLRGFGLI